MYRTWLFSVIALASAGAAHAQTESQLTFVGAIINGACDPAQPSANMQKHMERCGTAAFGAIYAEHTKAAIQTTGIAMLDYFTGRPDGGRKYVVTRDYL